MLNRDSVLLNCIRASLQGTLSQEDVRRLFGKPVEWGKLLNDVQVNGVGPLLYYILKEADANNLLPERVMSKLEIAYYSAFTRSIFYYAELSDILSSFQRSGIQAIVLKGAALAKVLYPDASLRPFGDIDLLIRDQDLLKAKGELQYLGYEEDTAREFHQGYREEFEKHFLYLRNGHIPVYIELHTSLLPFICAQKLEADGLWDRAVAVQMGEIYGLVLSAEDMILHLCIHIFNHNLSMRLLWLYDVALIILKYGENIDWELIEEKAKAFGIYRIVGLVLDRIIQTLNLPMPQGTASWLESCRMNLMERCLFANGISLIIWRYTLRSRIVKSVKDKLKLVAGQFFPSRGYIMRQYSISNFKFLFVGYLYHLCFIFLRAIRSVFASTYKSIKGGSLQ